MVGTRIGESADACTEKILFALATSRSAGLLVQPVSWVLAGQAPSARKGPASRARTRKSGGRFSRPYGGRVPRKKGLGVALAAALAVGRADATAAVGRPLRPRPKRIVSFVTFSRRRVGCAYEPWWLRLLAFMGERYERFLLETAHLEAPDHEGASR